MLGTYQNWGKGGKTGRFREAFQQIYTHGAVLFATQLRTMALLTQCPILSCLVLGESAWGAMSRILCSA